MRFRTTPPSELAARVEAALAALPSYQRAVFLTIRDEGVTYSELADWMGLHREEVAQAFVDALIALNEALERRELDRSIAAILHRVGSVLGLSRRRSGG